MDALINAFNFTCKVQALASQKRNATLLNTCQGFNKLLLIYMCVCVYYQVTGYIMLSANVSHHNWSTFTLTCKSQLV